MPPVFGPASPSPRRLWSCEVASGSTCAPSTMAMKLASSPSRNSSMTTLSPAGPKRPANIACGGRDGFVGRRADHHALAGREAVGLDDQRRALRAHPAGVEARAREGGVGRGRDRVAAQEVLHEGLRALEPRGEPARAEAAQARGLEGVDDAEHQRTLGAHDREVDPLGKREAQQGRHVVGRDVDVAACAARAPCPHCRERRISA